MPVYPKSKGKWRVRVWIDGKPKDEIFQGTNKEAWEYEAQRRAEVASAQRDGLRRVAPSFSVFSLGEYVDFCRDRVKASWWLKQKYVIATLIEFFGDYRLDKIPQAIVPAFTKDRRRRISATSVNNELRVFGRILNVARHEFRYPVTNLRLTPLREIGRGRPVAWTEEQMTKLFTTCAKVDIELLPLLTFIANTGCRNGEALALEWKQVDLETGYIRFWPSEYWQPKNNEPREVPIGDTLRPWLEAPHQHSRWVFASQLKSRFKYWPKLRWETVRDAAGLTGGVHQLRHTYASHFLKNNPDLILLAAVLGHSDVAVTKLYQHMLAEHLARARNVVSFVPPVGPAAVEAHRRWRMTKKSLRPTVPETVPVTVENSVTIERDTGFEPATFSLGS